MGVDVGIVIFFFEQNNLGIVALIDVRIDEFQKILFCAATPLPVRLSELHAPTIHHSDGSRSAI